MAAPGRAQSTWGCRRLTRGRRRLTRGVSRFKWRHGAGQHGYPGACSMAAPGVGQHGGAAA
eukprot:scaffold71455_cov95-Phaeocystis_antarctica.AAC.4